MINMLISLNPVISTLISMVVVVLLGFIPYFLGRRLFRKHINKTTQNAAVILYRSVGILLGLMLSMNFVDTRSEYVKIQSSVELEAKEIEELKNDLERFGTDEAEQLVVSLFEYTNHVIEEEWPQLAKGRQSEKAQDLFLKIETGILQLEANLPYQKTLKNRLIKDIDEVSDHRHTRVFAGNVTMSWFLTVVFIGFLISAFLLCVHPAKALTLLFIASYSAFIGIVIYSIIALNHPFQGLTHVSVKPFQAVSQEFAQSND
jgi:hypothetical protein